MKSPISSKEIEMIEKYVGLNFPDEYKEHLLKFNGGRCTPNIFRFIENGKESCSRISCFMAIYEGTYDSLKWCIDIFKISAKRMPEHILPIADDPFGNQICISCGRLDYGYIYFWDHENEVDYSESGDDDYFNLYLIAQSFSEFLNGLTTLEDN